MVIYFFYLEAIHVLILFCLLILSFTSSMANRDYLDSYIILFRIFSVSDWFIARLFPWFVIVERVRLFLVWFLKESVVTRI